MFFLVVSNLAHFLWIKQLQWSSQGFWEIDLVRKKVPSVFRKVKQKSKTNIPNSHNTVFYLPFPIFFINPIFVSALMQYQCKQCNSTTPWPDLSVLTLFVLYWSSIPHIVWYIFVLFDVEIISKSKVKFSVNQPTFRDL